MQTAKAINQLIQFMVEMAMLGAMGYSGFHLGKTPVAKFALAFVLLSVVVVLWWLFAAPKAPHRLKLPARLFFKLALFLIAAWLLFLSGQQNLAIGFAMVAVINECIAACLKQ